MASASDPSAVAAEVCACKREMVRLFRSVGLKDQVVEQIVDRYFDLADRIRAAERALRHLESETGMPPKAFLAMCQGKDLRTICVALGRRPDQVKRMKKEA